MDTKIAQSISESYCVGYNFHLANKKDRTPDFDCSEKEGCFDNLFGRIIQFYLNNTDMEMDAFLESLPLDSDLTEAEQSYVKLYAMVLYMSSKGFRRVDIWDALFESKYINKETHPVLLDTYYKYPIYTKSMSDVLFVFQASLYDFWHNPVFINCLRKTYLNCDKSHLVAAITALQQGEYYHTYLEDDSEWESSLPYCEIKE